MRASFEIPKTSLFGMYAMAIWQTLLVAFRHPHQGLGISFWCAKKALSIGVFADAFEDSAHRRGESLLAGRFFSGRGIKTRQGRLCGPAEAVDIG
jgi:hypothetical protein